MWNLSRRLEQPGDNLLDDPFVIGFLRQWGSITRIEKAKAAIHRADPSQSDAELLEVIEAWQKRRDEAPGMHSVWHHYLGLIFQFSLGILLRQSKQEYLLRAM